MEAWAGHLARMGCRRGTYGVLMGELVGQRPLGIGRLGWDGIMYCKEMGCFWTGLVWLRTGTGGGLL